MSALCDAAAQIVGRIPPSAAPSPYRLLRAAEPEVSEALSGYLRDEGIELHNGVAYQSVAQDQTGLSLALRIDGRTMTLTAERLLVATGRTPNVEGLGLGEAGVEQASDGGIRVDDRMRTARPGVYAAGDVTGRDQFVPARPPPRAVPRPAKWPAPTPPPI